MVLLVGWLVVGLVGVVGLLVGLLGQLVWLFVCLIGVVGLLVC